MISPHSKWMHSQRTIKYQDSCLSSGTILPIKGTPTHPHTHFQLLHNKAVVFITLFTKKNTFSLYAVKIC